jgi:cyclomaltodextrinase / maltogenic alpha-amylase / neopullulanase
MNRFLYECQNDTEKLKTAARLQFSLNQPLIIYYGTEVGMTHEQPVGIGGMHSDLRVRQPMIWNRPDCKLLAFYKQLIREGKELATANTSREVPHV